MLLPAACGSETPPPAAKSAASAVAVASRTAELRASPTATRARRSVVASVHAVPAGRGCGEPERRAGALKFFTEDVVWERGRQCPPTICKGIQTVQRELMRDVSAHHQMTPLSGEIVPGGQRIRAETRTDGTRRGGVDRIIQFFSLEMRGERIAAVRASFDVSDAVTTGVRSIAGDAAEPMCRGE